MNWEFEATLKRKSHRQRFYSSMNYEEYCDVYGPPAPLFKYFRWHSDRRTIPLMIFPFSIWNLPSPSNPLTINPVLLSPSNL